MPSAFYTLSLHDALPIFFGSVSGSDFSSENTNWSVDWETLGEELPLTPPPLVAAPPPDELPPLLVYDPSWLGVSFGISFELSRSEEHTSELQSHSDLVCRPRFTLFPYTTLFRSFLAVSPAPISLARTPIGPLTGKLWGRNYL